MASLLIGLAMAGLAHRPALAQSLDTKLWGTNGNVASIARSGTTLYIAGALGEVGPNTGGGVVLSTTTGAADSLFPKVTGYVYAAVPDGQGGWFVGGDFTAVGGQPRSSLAHILQDGSVASWAPSQDDHNINCLAVSEGTLYVGGLFHVMDGQPRQGLAAFDAKDGALLPWDPHPDGSIVLGPVVTALVVRGDTVILAGDFREVGGQPRVGLAGVDAKSGHTLTWYPGGANSIVLALALNGNVLYVGGYFTQFAGRTHNRAVAVDLSSAALLPWNPNVTGPDDLYGFTPRVMAIAVKDSSVVLGGVFSSAGGQPRVALAAVDADTGGALPWNPGPAHAYSYPPPYVRSLAVQGDTVYVGGNFEMIGGADRISLSALDANTGTAMSWNPRPDYDHDVIALAASPGVVYVGGTFFTIGPWKSRNTLAAIDLTTGAVKDWDPQDNGIDATSIVVSEGKVYVAGDFTFIGGQPRVGIAALDTLTGAALPWNPGVDNWIDTMVMNGGKLYVGGQFLNIGGQPRPHAAALDTATGVPTAWNPDPDDDVTSLATNDETVYLGGWFRHVGGVPRSSLAAVDAVTGAIRGWRADCDGSPVALVASGLTAFVGGPYLSTFNGQPRTDLAVLDATTGAVKPWDPHLSGSIAFPAPAVNALALSGHTLYVGGDFYSIGGQVRPCLAALDDSIGLATDWAPHPNFPVKSLAVSGNTLYAGGIFGAVGLLPCHGLAALTIPSDPIPSPVSFALEPSMPNPATAGTNIPFTLPAASIATLEIYDVQGRRVATPVRPTPLGPGRHVLAVRLDGLKPGIYVYRLEAQGRTASRKLVIAR